MFCFRKSAYYEQCNQSLNFMQITCSIIYADLCKYVKIKTSLSECNQWFKFQNENSFWNSIMSTFNKLHLRVRAIICKLTIFLKFCEVPLKYIMCSLKWYFRPACFLNGCEVIQFWYTKDPFHTTALIWLLILLYFYRFHGNGHTQE